MKKFLRNLVNVVQAVSFCGLMLAGLSGLAYDLLGWMAMEKLFAAMGISRWMELGWWFGGGMLLLLLLTSFLKNRFFRKEPWEES